MRLRQQGSAKAILPHVGGHPEVVFLNTAGGLTAGDRLSYATEVPAGMRLTATTQTAERAYRAEGGEAEVRVTHRVEGWLDWLPQETILFDCAALHRVTEIDLVPALPSSGCGREPVLTLAGTIRSRLTQEPVRPIWFKRQEGIRRPACRFREKRNEYPPG